MRIKNSFTLLELLIVIGVIAILSTILLTILKPQEIFSKARDVERITDLTNYEKNIKLALLEPYTKPDPSNIIYISLKDSATNCDSYISELPTLPSGWSYKCSANPEKTDGTGWIPINFSSSSVINISNLKLDPTNTGLYYYSFVLGTSTNGLGFELTAYLEHSPNRATTSSASSNDGGTNLALYEAGNNKTITPTMFEEGRIGVIASIFTVRDGSYNITPANPGPAHDSNIGTNVLIDPGLNNWYIEQDFQQSISINKFRVNATMGPPPPPSLSIEYFNGSSWIFVGAISSNGWFEFPVSITVTKWRVGITMGTYVYVNEMEVNTQ